MTDALEGHLLHQTERSGRFFWHRLRWRAVRTYLPEDEPFELLDVGAGAGIMGAFLKKDRPMANYRFIEPIPKLRIFLENEYGNLADAAAASDYRFAQVVTLLDVLEHQEDDKAFLQTLVEKMKPGATLVLTVPALRDLWSSWDVALGHFRRYDIPALHSVVDDLPLVIHEMSFMFPEMVPLAKLRKRRTVRTSSGYEQDAELPDLPRLVNDVLYGAGSLSVDHRHRWKTGTSLFLAATVN